jgi:hypothetical protein
VLRVLEGGFAYRTGAWPAFFSSTTAISCDNDVGEREFNNVVMNSGANEGSDGIADAE